MDEQQKNTNEEDIISSTKESVVIQQVYTEANTASFGTIKELEPGFCSLLFTPTAQMKVDALGLIHAGYIVSAANYAAMCAVNEPTGIPIKLECSFFTPFELGNTIELRAQMMQDDTKKREVQVEGFVLDIKVFQALFEVAIFEHHVLKLQITGPKKVE